MISDAGDLNIPRYTTWDTYRASTWLPPDATRRANEHNGSGLLFAKVWKHCLSDLYDTEKVGLELSNMAFITVIQ